MLYLTLWNCEDDCKYDCMWKTIEVFHQRNWRTPQFYGKVENSHSQFSFSYISLFQWPFIRMFGMQEPASVLFSLLNGFVHIYMIKKFRKKVRPDSPLIWLWHVFFIVSNIVNFLQICNLYKHSKLKIYFHDDSPFYNIHSIIKEIL